MVDGSYSFETDPARNFLRINLTGNWDLPLVERFTTDVATTIRGMIVAGATPGEFRTIVDMSRKYILPQNAVSELGRMIRPDSPSRKIALLVSGTLHKLQAKRFTVSDKHRTFDQESDAVAWLWTDADDTASPAP
ncbi:hypothetical protein ASE75_11980 [Sphingomonas sp. Leaf17]|uniref:hypothetical protein n=1 Tax=Sphingomonas sp. Leaf17 TaxID=1735683 RepID=UPI00070061D4|nr:hypothetical protein [Sphingomonas sp. Leaf17]KQM63195.1 hypothetical protein ASE75_11980 [Sphingomonas sp. Leaf17]